MVSNVSSKFNIFINWCIENPKKTFVLMALFFTVDHYILGPFSYIKWHDLGDSHVPHLIALTESIAKFGQHYWFPYAAGGIDNLATGHLPYTIFHVIFVVLPDWLAFPSLRLISLFISAWFTYLICLEYLRLSPFVSIIGGVINAAAVSNLMFSYFGIGAVPLIIWSIEKVYVRQSKWKYLIVAFIGLAYGFTAPQQMTTPYVVPLIFLWLYLARNIPFLTSVILTTIFSAFAFLPQLDALYAMMTNVAFSHRSTWGPGAPSLSDVASVLFNHWLIFLFSIIAIILTYKKDHVSFLVFSFFIASLFIMYFQPHIRELIGDDFGFLKGYSFFRIVSFSPIFLTFGAMIGLNELFKVLEGKETSLGFIRANMVNPSIVNLSQGILIIFIIYQPVLEITKNAKDWIKWGGYTAYGASPNIEMLAETYKSSPEPFRVVTTQENGLYASMAHRYGLETADGYLTVYPEKYSKFWGMVTEPYLKRNAKAEHAFMTGSRIILGTDDNHPISINVDEYFKTNLLSLMNVRYIISNIPLIGKSLKLIEGTKPERYWDELSTQEKVKARIIENFQGRHVMVYEITDVLPRWFLSNKVEYFENEVELKRSITNKSSADISLIAMLDKKYTDDIGLLAGGDGTGTIDTVVYAPDRIVLNVTSDKNTFLTVSNSYNPYWEVYIDNVPAKIYPSYGTFWGVSIKSGSYSVEFRYNPPYKFYNTKRFK